MALVAGTGALLAMFGNPFFGKMSDRTSSQLGMRRPWMVIGLVAIGGLGFGVYVSVDLALVADVLPDKDSAAKDLGAFNIAGALPFSVAPAIAPVILAIGAGSYGVLYAVRSPRGEAGRARAGMCRFRHGTDPAVPRVKGCWRR